MCYSYDGNGNVTQKTDNRNISITYGYDQMNRLVSKTYSSGDPSACIQYNNPVAGANDLNSLWFKPRISGTILSMPMAAL